MLAVGRLHTRLITYMHKDMESHRYKREFTEIGMGREIFQSMQLLRINISVAGYFKVLPLDLKACRTRTNPLSGPNCGVGDPGVCISTIVEPI